MCYAFYIPNKGGTLVKENASIEIRYVEDQNDQVGALLVKSTKDKLSAENGEEFKMWTGDRFKVNFPEGLIDVKVINTVYDNINKDKYVFFVTKA